MSLVRRPREAHRLLGIGITRRVFSKTRHGIVNITRPITTSPEPPPSPTSSTTSSTSTTRLATLKNARPFSDFLTDSFSRQHTYLRISLTERCNLRCVYCMPEEGVPLSPPRELLTTPEIILLARLFVAQGVDKIRLTGGEPTVRPDFVALVKRLGELKKAGSGGSDTSGRLKELCITTNGIALHRKLDDLRDAGLTGVNLSLDTLNRWQFEIMTRRRGFDAVVRSMNRILEMNQQAQQGDNHRPIRLKINCVVMRGINDNEIPDFVDLTRTRALEVRFIEYMPFSGNRWDRAKMVPYAEMLSTISALHPTLERAADEDAPTDTSKTWRVPGHAGRLGFVTSMTHNFCGSCNRLRVTSEGQLKVCLFGEDEVSLRDGLRAANGGEPIDEEALARMEGMAREEREAAVRRGQQQQAQERVCEDQDEDEYDQKVLRAAGIPAENAETLLAVVRAAVKRKKARHAGMDSLKHMKNRPMILIEDSMAKRQLPFIFDIGHASTISSSISSVLPFLPSSVYPTLQARLMTTSRPLRDSSSSSPSSSPSATPPPSTTTATSLTHVSPSGTAHMVSIADKQPTKRTATAACTVLFSSPSTARLVRANALKKGDVLATARIAGIMGAKRTPDLVPLCHPIAITHASVDLEVEGGFEVKEERTEDKEYKDDKENNENKDNENNEGDYGCVHIRATVSCEGKTGVEMEALTAASTAALTVYDMCKAVDRGMRIEGLRVVLKEGGKSGRWEMP